VSKISDAPVFPPGRYGRRRERRRTPRWLPVALLLPVLVGVVWLAGRLYGQYGDPPYQVTVRSQGAVTQSSVAVTFTVHKRDGGPAVCKVQAKDRSAAEIGYAEVPVGPGTDVTVTYTLVTHGRPDAVEVLSCHAA
jgi:Domain of unknown function (DUF4307)